MLPSSKACSTSKTQPKCFHFFASLLTTHFVTVNRNIWYECDESVSRSEPLVSLGSLKIFFPFIATALIFFDSRSPFHCA
jgi:hypothetical protein